MSHICCTLPILLIDKIEITIKWLVFYTTKVQCCSFHSYRQPDRVYTWKIVEHMTTRFQLCHNDRLERKKNHDVHQVGWNLWQKACTTW